jgi:hypothetical protein
VDTYDPFVTGQPLTLHLIAHAQECPRRKKHAMIFQVSPQPAGTPIWRALANVASTFRCD